MTLCALAAARKESFPTGLYSQGLIFGGPVVLVWGWVCAGGLHTLAAFSMSELSSAFPVSGGLYYWSFMLGGNHGPFVSWMVGWINLLGQVCYIVSPRSFAYKHATQPTEHLHVCHCPCTAHHAFVTTPVAWAVDGDEQSQCIGSILAVDCEL